MKKFGLIADKNSASLIIDELNSNGVTDIVLLPEHSCCNDVSLPESCEWLIIKHPSVTASYLRHAIKRGCKILLLNIPKLELDELNDLILLNEEADGNILLYDAALCTLGNLAQCSLQKSNSLIDCRISSKGLEHSKETLLRVLFLLSLSDTSQLKRISFMSIPHRLADVRYTMNSGTVLRLLLLVDKHKDAYQQINVYREDSSVHAINLAQTEHKALAHTIKLLLNNDKSIELLPNLNNLRDVLIFLEATKAKLGYAEFFSPVEITNE